jgi:hypothetical protein
MHDVFRNSKKNHKVEKKELKTRTKEIPLIDPQTGELNPLYEELTGQPHPYSKKVNIEDIGKFNMPPVYEPKMNNRFTTVWPKEFDLQSWVLKSAARPMYHIFNDKWEDMLFSFYDPIAPPTSQSLYKLIDNGKVKDEFTFELHLLGPVGDVVEKWEITGKIKAIDFGALNYDKSKVTEIFMAFTPSKCNLLF